VKIGRVSRDWSGQFETKHDYLRWLSANEGRVSARRPGYHAGREWLCPPRAATYAPPREASEGDRVAKATFRSHRVDVASNMQTRYMHDE
jgi:hypothetical protein